MQRLLLMTCCWRCFRLHKLRKSTGLGGAAGWILMIALLAIWLLFLWSLWYSCSNDDNLSLLLWVRSFSYICYFMLNLEDHGDVGPHGWLLDTYVKMLFWYKDLSWKDCIDAAKNLKAWLLLYWCHNHWMTLEDTTTLICYICSPGKQSNISERSWTPSLPCKESDLVEI